jgi:hypothetical protein
VIRLKKEDTYSRTKVMESPGWKITIHFPDLSAEERAKRQKELHDAATRFMKAVISETKESNKRGI